MLHHSIFVNVRCQLLMFNVYCLRRGSVVNGYRCACNWCCNCCYAFCCYIDFQVEDPYDCYNWNKMAEMQYVANRLTSALVYSENQRTRCLVTFDIRNDWVPGVQLDVDDRNCLWLLVFLCLTKWQGIALIRNMQVLRAAEFTRYGKSTVSVQWQYCTYRRGSWRFKKGLLLTV